MPARACLALLLMLPLVNARGAEESLRLSELIDYEVQSTAGHRIGEVRDVMFTASGDIDAVAVEFDAGGSGYALARFDWADIELRAAQDGVVVSLGRDSADVQHASVAQVDDGITGRQLLDMQLLEGQRVLAQVDDVLIDTAAGRAEAFIMAGEGGTRQVLPATQVAISREALRAKQE